MKKKDLLNITLPDVPEELVREALNDRCIRRGFGVYGTTYEVNSYGTQLYFGAGMEGGILIIQMWARLDLTKGSYEPISVTYIDEGAEKWITRKENRWSEALLENVVQEYRHQPKTYWAARNVSTKEETALCNELLGTEEDSVEDAVSVWQARVRARKNLKRAERRKEDWDRMMGLIPEKPADFTQWAEGEGTIDDNFLLFKRQGKTSEVYCTYCGATYETTEKMLHNAGRKTHWGYERKHRGFCRECRNFFDTKSWRKQDKLRTSSWVVLPQVSGEYISMRSFEVVKKFRKKAEFGEEEKWGEETYIREDSRIFTDPQSFESVDSFRWEIADSISRTEPCWRRVRGTDYSRSRYPYQIQFGNMYMRNAEEICRAAGMQKFLYEKCQGSQHDSPQRMLIEIAKKKYLEYLYKAGLNRVAEAAISKSWMKCMKLKEDARNLKELLGIDGQMLRTMKDIDGHYEMIETLREIARRKEKVDIETLRAMNESEVFIGHLLTEKTGMTVQRTMNYLKKQAAKENKSLPGILAEYRDYLSVAERLGYDTKDEIICRTPDLKRMHDRYSEHYNQHKDQIEERNADKKYAGIKEGSEKNTKHFHYEKEGLLILVPGSASDIIREGREQHHCVGASNLYMERMQKGESYILFLRKKEEPEKPYYTLEVTWDGHVRQSYGAFDRKPDQEKIDGWLRYFSRTVKKRKEKEEAEQRVLVAAV